MDLRHVEYFVAVVDHGGITKAARSLYIAQPSLSQAIRNFEERLGTRLFDRTGRRLTLTADGAAFVGTARRILADAQRARKKAQAVRDLQSGRLEVASVSMLSVDPLPELISRLLAEHPGIRVDVSDASGSGDVVNQVSRGRVELGLSTLPTPSGTPHTHELGEQEIVLVLPPSLAVDLPDPVPLEAIGTIPLVLETSSNGRPGVDDALDDVIRYVAVECDHRQALWSLVMCGAGATFLPRRIAEAQLHNVVVRSILPPVKRTVGVVCRTGSLSPAAAAFLRAADALRHERSP